MVIAVLLELFKVIKDHPLNFYWKGMAKSFLQTIIPIVMICLLNYISGQGESVDYNNDDLLSCNNRFCLCVDWSFACH